MSGVRVVLVTASDETVGARICRTLLEEHLIACGNIVSGVRSLYRWKGDLHDEAEVLLVMKTSADRVGDVLERVPRIHPYDVPEIVVLDVEAGHPPYLDWVLEETTEQERAEGR